MQKQLDQMKQRGSLASQTMAAEEMQALEEELSAERQRVQSQELYMMRLNDEKRDLEDQRIVAAARRQEEEEACERLRE